MRASRGEPIDDAVAEIRALGAGFADDPRWQVNMLDPVGNAALAAGRLEDARHAWVTLAELDHDQITEFRYRAARPALWNGDLVSLREDLAALDATGIHGLVVEGRRMSIEAGIAALEGRRGDALLLYRDAIEKWRDLGQPWDEALTVIDVATVLDTADADIRRAAERSREFLARVRATPFVERLDAAMKQAPRTDHAITGGLSTPAARTAEPEEKATTGG